MYIFVHILGKESDFKYDWENYDLKKSFQRLDSFGLAKATK